MEMSEFKFHIAHFRDFHRVVAGLGEILHGLAHFLFGLHIELVVLELHAVRLVDRGTGADAQHDVLGLGVFLQQVVEVVGGNGL